MGYKDTKGVQLLLDLSHLVGEPILGLRLVPDDSTLSHLINRLSMCGMGKKVRNIDDASHQREGVTPHQAVSMLAKSGVNMEKKEAKKVLEVMIFLAKLIVNQNFKT